MPKQKQNTELRRYAVIGAEQRLLQIAEEAAVIFRAFPELRGRGFMERSVGDTAQEPVRRKRRRKMSAEARRKISQAQKARWAKQKGENGAAAKGASAKKK